VRVRTVDADRLMSDTLEVPAGSPLIFLERILKVGDTPAVLAMNLLARNNVDPQSLEGFEGSICDFLEEHHGTRITYGVAKILPAQADASLARRLQVSRGGLLVLLEQVDYDEVHRPILFSREYWVSDVIEFTIFRRRGK